MSAWVTRLVPTLTPFSSILSTVSDWKMLLGSVTTAVKSSLLRASISLVAIQARQASTTLTQTMNVKYISPPRQPEWYSWLWRTGR